MKSLSTVSVNNLKRLSRIAQETSRKAALISSGPVFRHSLRSFSSRKGMELGLVVDRLQRYASPSLAASWDNVGLLLEPSPPHVVSRVLLTNDLTPEVVAEAIELKTDLIISYHPPIFKPFKKLTQKAWKERILVQCIENRMAVYSPHTSYDALSQGINDWLAAPFEGKSEPIIASSQGPALGEYSVAVNFPEGLSSGIEDKLTNAITGIAITGRTSLGSEPGDAVRLRLTCARKSLPEIISFFENSGKNSVEIVELVKPPLPGYGFGRLTTLDRPMTIQDAVLLVKTHLKMTSVRLALGSGKTTGSEIQTVAVCAGSGSSILGGMKADLYLTGEMSHHEVLDAVQNGTSVVLCEHSNTERGFLAILRQTLDVLFENKIDIHLSTMDRDPLEII